MLFGNIFHEIFELNIKKPMISVENLINKAKSLYKQNID